MKMKLLEHLDAAGNRVYRVKQLCTYIADIVAELAPAKQLHLVTAESTNAIFTLIADEIVAAELDLSAARKEAA